MKQFLIFFSALFFISASAQLHQNKLKFYKVAINEYRYHLYVENPTKQIRSFRSTIKGKNFTSLMGAITQDTIAPNSKRMINMVDKINVEKEITLGFSWVEAVGNMFVRKTLDHKYQLPYARESAYEVVQGPNEQFSHKNTFAFDFLMPEGTSVHAIRSGQIFDMKLEEEEGCPEDVCERMANYIKILHYDGTVSEYRHLAPNSSSRRIGDFVNTGQFIARSGMTGKLHEPILHVEVQILSRDLSEYVSSPIEFVVSPDGSSQLLNKADNFVRY